MRSLKKFDPSPNPCYGASGYTWEQALAKPSEELFWDNVTELMKEKEGASQAALADHVGVDPSTCNLWMKRKTCPDVHKLTKIAEYFDVEIARLFEDRSTKDPGLEQLTLAYRIMGDAIKHINNSKRASKK